MNRYYFTCDEKEGRNLKSVVKKAADTALKFEGFFDDCEISVTFTNDKGIRVMNYEYREKDSATDVLSFPAFDDKSEADINSDNGCIILGDIVISLERAKKQAEEYSHSLEREIAFLTVHSILHLLGYDHEKSDDEEEIMFSKQKEILNLAGYTRDDKGNN